MPEDMRELFRQRQRELAAERAQLAADAETEGADESTVTIHTEPNEAKAIAAGCTIALIMCRCGRATFLH